jgi:hypothetical protein
MLTPSKAKTGFDFCEEILLEEKKLKGLDPEERKKMRNKKIKPIIDRFYLWCDQVDPRGATKDFKDALTYARNQKESLCRFLEDGNIPAHNNRAENAIRPFVIGRKTGCSVRRQKVPVPVRICTALWKLPRPMAWMCLHTLAGYSGRSRQPTTISQMNSWKN